MVGSEARVARGIARKLRGLRSGTVRSISGAKTISVRVDTLVKHERYGKYIKRSSQVAVHDPDEDAQAGDIVEIIPCRPLSKSKSWRLVRVVRRSALGGQQPAGRG